MYTSIPNISTDITGIFNKDSFGLKSKKVIRIKNGIAYSIFTDIAIKTSKPRHKSTIFAEKEKTKHKPIINKTFRDTKR